MGTTTSENIVCNVLQIKWKMLFHPPPPPPTHTHTSFIPKYPSSPSAPPRPRIVPRPSSPPSRCTVPSRAVPSSRSHAHPRRPSTTPSSRRDAGRMPPRGTARNCSRVSSPSRNSRGGTWACIRDGGAASPERRGWGGRGDDDRPYSSHSSSNAPPPPAVVVVVVVVDSRR